MLHALFRMHWRRNLIFIWLSQFLSIMGFAFALPFAPFYIQDLGVSDPVKIKLWVSIFAAATPLSLAVFSPMWGALGDRYGRRLMMLRANFAAALVLFMMGHVHSVVVLVGLRVMQGAFTGTMTAAQAMVAVHTPENRSGMALGTLSAAVFSGAMVGSACGGWFADRFGYRGAFFIAAALTLLAGIVVLFGTRELVRPLTGDERPARGAGWAQLRACLPVLLLIAAIAYVRQFDMPMLPLLVQEIHGSMDGVSSWTGSLFAVGSVAGLLSGIVLGRAADHAAAPKIGMFCALFAAVLMVPQGLAASFGPLFAARFGMIFCSGGLDPVFQVWLAKITPENHRGLIFGWAGTAKSLGWILAPLTSGVVATGFGVRSVYFASSVLFLMLIPLIHCAVRWIDKAGARRTA
ncbi:MAG: MFS transporter [Verrucomicrobia bacterium]|nr:MFS transporter [Verrucomicrobiota bacterium]